MLPESAAEPDTGRVACPLLSVAVPSVWPVVSSTNVTEPVGVLLLLAVTVAVSVTD